MQDTPVKDNQFRMRGENMTRIETFVAAAFAFAITMLIISLDDMPGNMDEFIVAIKNVPSFLTSSAIIILVWYAHADWSRRYGLENRMTIVLSSSLICIVFIFMFPLRLIMQGLFFVLSDGYFPFGIKVDTLANLRILFLFYAVGFLALSANFWALFSHALHLREQLQLNAFELNYTQRYKADWRMSTAISSMIIVVMYFVSETYLIHTPHLFFILFFKKYLIKRIYDRRLNKR